MRLLHYIASLIIHVVFTGIGKRPPASVPFSRRKSLPIVPIPMWQVLVAFWLCRKFWQRYGEGVSHRTAEYAANYNGPGAKVIHNVCGISSTSHATITVEPISHQTEF